MQPKYLKVEADVRYWDGATINGTSSEQGENVPFKNGATWEPVIDLDQGLVVNWPQGVIADFHAAENMIRGMIDMINPKKRFFAPSLRMVICIPTGITEVE